MIGKGDRVTLDVIETNIFGCGVAKIDDMVVFCRGAVCGDEVSAVITDVKKNFAEAKALEIIKPSEHRRSPSCPYAAECGGCVFDGVTPEHEREVKRRGIEAAFRREKQKVRVSAFFSGEEIGYRNKALFHFDKDGKCGFYAEGTREFVRIEKCLLCDGRINEIKKTAEELIASDGGIDPAALTYLYIRYMKETDESFVVLGYRGEGDLSRFANALVNGGRRVAGVFRGHSEAPESKGERFELLEGDGTVTARVAGIDFEISPEAFFQVNNEGAEELCRAVCDMAKLKDGERAADIYCGAGLFGLALAKRTRGAEVYGIELRDAAVRGANRAAGANGIENAFFLQGDSSELAAKAGVDSVDVAVVDPPRSGLSKKTVDELVKLSPERIIYVSCNPSTLARDVASLGEHYTVSDVRGVDMFPRTRHVETVVLVSRGEINS
ncbi:MAG: 23S rRNA (uracil(1939)-C(5))-methyltransferase RlmD [Clostridia bacterium]|nr:23S rRNA (uracil(1939)-C(5))-methyltransferase RlmD [Clostridia bacterium]